MRQTMGFGKQKLTLELPDENVMAVLTPNPVSVELTGADEVRRALFEPIGKPRLREVAPVGKKIAIVTSDITRPVPSYVILPELLSELSEAGVRDEDVTVVFALGSHRGHSEADMRHLAGDGVFERVTCVDSDPSDCVRMGVTERGTPVDITRVVAEADYRICVGNIEYHYFAGYSGGAKAIMPGVSTREAIQSNHSRMVQKEAAAGRIEGNPVREDIEEVMRYCPVDYIVNVVLDETKRIIRAVCGDVVLAHREGCRFLDTLYKVSVPGKADLVVASAAGFPKDINLYQAQKALDNAAHAVRDGGVIVLVAECSEGLGEAKFKRWMETMEPDEMIVRIREHFELGGHKAAAIAMTLSKADIYLVSGMDAEAVRKMHLTPFSTLEDAVNAAYEKLGRGMKALVMPYAGSTLPVCEA